jgi:hypothetical protein
LVNITYQVRFSCYITLLRHHGGLCSLSALWCHTVSVGVVNTLNAVIDL